MDDNHSESGNNPVNPVNGSLVIPGRPSALCSISNPRSPRAHHHLLYVPQCSLSLYSRAFRVFAPKIWNSRTLHIRQLQSLSIFRHTILSQRIWHSLVLIVVYCHCNNYVKCHLNQCICNNNNNYNDNNNPTPSQPHSKRAQILSMQASAWYK